jgi:hypothetical protein
MRSALKGMHVQGLSQLFLTKAANQIIMGVTMRGPEHATLWQDNFELRFVTTTHTRNGVLHTLVVFCPHMPAIAHM